jgi:hypothetical protein
MLKRYLAGLVVVVTASGAIAGPQHTLSNLHIIHLKAGSNRIEHFAPDGLPAIITLGWRDNGNAHGYDLFLVLMPTKAGSSDWSVVDVVSGDPNTSDYDTIRDDPHTGDDFVSAVRFVQGSLDGTPATLLLTATRDLGEAGIPAPSLVTYEVYQLVQNDQAGSGTVDLFHRIEASRSEMKFCNAELALSKQFEIPLPKNYSGPNIFDGCS